MMDSLTLQDRLSRGMGSAARVLGAPHDLFRPRGAARPMAPENRMMRLPVMLDGGDPGYRRPQGYERGLRGMFDSISVRVGDYLLGPRGVLFVAALPPLLRPLCVLTTTVLDVVRPGGAGAAGLNGYGGVSEGGLEPVLTGWPAQVLAQGSSRPGALAVDGGLPGWSVLLPATPVAIRGSDLLRDEAGRRFVVRVAEQSEMGWRLLVGQAGV